jgi:4-hydroxy-2-oxovalerate aldolase
MINIVENTLRDGSYAVDFQFTSKNTFDLVKGLEELGFQYIEIGHGLGLGAWKNPKAGLARESDEEYIQSAKKAVKESLIGVFFIPGIGTKDDILKAKEKGIDFIRIGNNIDDFSKIRPYAEYAKSLGLMVCVNLMKSYAVKSYEFARIVSEIDKWQVADVIYLVDSAGGMLPNEVFQYIDRTKEKVQTELGFHGHNNLSLALANTMEAIKAGATYVDSCIRGMGRSAGNAQSEILIYILQRMNLLDKKIDYYEMYDFANSVVVPLMKRPQGLTDEEIHIGLSKFHTSYMPFVNSMSDKYKVDKRKVIKDVSDINCINPGEDLFERVALYLKEQENK